ncbi:toll-like receptor 4 [Physella acuta]|uniref:toll-like receptor 4 n=1 Tax=Physella acuta TaxID=109671 RepID=UPI0027DD619D|nr:toll-like receptor 4 [Physella acuta]
MDLAYNVIPELAGNVFQGLQNLQFLSMAQNGLKILNANTFSGLTSLKELIIIEDFNLDISDAAFVGLNNLTDLKFLILNFTIDENRFHEQTLESDSSNPIYPSATCYPDKAISVLSNLQTIDLVGRNCKLGSGFQKLKRLENITFRYACNITQLSDFHFANIHSDRNISIYLRACPISTFAKTSFVMKSNLISLDLSNTKLSIQQILDSVQIFKNLRELSIDFLISIKTWYSLESVLASFVETKISYLNLDGNNLLMSSVTDTFKFPPNLESLSLRYSNYIDIEIFITALRMGPRNSLKRLTVTQTTHIKKKDNVRWQNMSRNFTPRQLHQELTEDNGVSKLEYLNVAGNSFGRFSPIDLLKGMNSLKVLDVSRSPMGMYLLTYTTSPLPNFLSLRELILDDCFLNFIQKGFFFPKNLKKLYLSGNDLKVFRSSTVKQCALTYLDLSYNSLPGLSNEMCTQLKRFQSEDSSFRINLLLNEFQFTCTNIQILHLLADHQHMFVDVDDLKFITASNVVLYYTEMIELLPRLTKNCAIKENFSYVLSLFFTHLLCLLVLAVFFHYRWKLRYLYFIGQRRLHIGGRLVNYNPQVDVFITYDEGEVRIRQIVRNIILPFLREKNISYILGEVDFPGGDMTSHISGAITGTRKTLVLLSEDLFLDHYREYEMNLAIMREFNVRGQVIVPVFVERVDLNTYPPEVETYLRNQLYRCLVYRNNQTFWTLLLHAIRNDK